MIARIWHGRVPAEKAVAYHQFLLKSGLADYKATPGNQGVFLLKQEEKGITHFYTLTFWKDKTSIVAFAGDDYENARYYKEDKDYLLEFEPKVSHYDVVEKPSWWK
jgi:heme-degrading monooxygenase HmoA